VTPPNGSLDHERRRLSQVAANNRGLDALSRIRHGESLAGAARNARTDPRTVKRNVGPALERRGGRWAAKPSDRLPRHQWTTVIAPDGGPALGLVETRSSRMASKVSAHNADTGVFESALSSPEAKREAQARLTARHGRRAGRRAVLTDGTEIRDPSFYGQPDGLQALHREIDLSDIDFGSDSPTRFSG